MKKRILFLVFGMSFALTACAGQEASSEQTEVEQPIVHETEAASEDVQETQESTQAVQVQEQEKETEAQTIESEPETHEEETKAQETEAPKAAETQPEAAQTKGTLTQGDIAVTVRGVAVTPGEIMENYINSLGEPDDLQGSPSCVEEGDDKTYIYGGVVIYTYRSNGTDLIHLIEITGTESLGKGIHIGDTKDAVIAAYGDSYTMEGNEMIYELNDKVIGLQITDGTVSFMELFAR